MDFSTVYDMDVAWTHGAMWVREKEMLQREYCLALARGEVFPERPVVLVHGGGGKPRDAIHADALSFALYSDKVINVLRSEGFTGWTTYAVEVYGKKRERIPGYHGLAVTGRCGPIDWSRSRWIWLPPPGVRGRGAARLLGVYFDPATWDGSHVFIPTNTSTIVVVEKVKEALCAAKVTNVQFTPLAACESSSPPRAGPPGPPLPPGPDAALLGYNLSSESVNSAEVYWITTAELPKAMRAFPCDAINRFALIRGESSPSRPLRFRPCGGNRRYDLMDASRTELYLVSDGFLEVLERYGFTGWTTYPVDLCGSGGRRVRGYHGFAVTGRCGPIDHTRCQPGRRWRPAGMPADVWDAFLVGVGQEDYSIWRGLYFDPASWDGSDFFMPEASAFHLVTGHVKEALERAELTNLHLRRVTEIEFVPSG